MTSFMEIMTSGGSMMNGKGVMELPDEWETLQLKK
jgi:hypothetical protein